MSDLPDPDKPVDAAAADAPLPHITDPAQIAAIRARQAARSRVMGLLLASLAILFFAITIAKMKIYG